MIVASSLRPTARGDVASGATSSEMSSKSSDRGGLEFEFVIRRRFAEFRGALAVCDPVEKTIYERRVIALEESMRDIEILVDDDLCRHVPAGNQFIDARAQNRAKDRVNSLQFPAFGETGGNCAVDFNLMVWNAAHDIGKEFSIRLAGGRSVACFKTMLAEFLGYCLSIASGQLHLVDRLDGRKAGRAPRIVPGLALVSGHVSDTPLGARES